MFGAGSSCCTRAWYDPEDLSQAATRCKHGLVNLVTLDKGTSKLAQGNVANTVLVQVAKLTSEEGLKPPGLERTSDVPLLTQLDEVVYSRGRLKAGPASPNSGTATKGLFVEIAHHRRVSS